MKKQDILIVVVLFGLWLLWSPLDRMFIKPTFFPDPPASETVDRVVPDEVTPTAVEGVPRPDTPIVPPSLSAPEQAITPLAEPPPISEEALADEKLIVLENDHMAVTFSTLGGTVREVLLKKYREEDRADSPPVTFDFHATPALAIEGMTGFTVGNAFEMTLLPDGAGVRFFRAMPGSLSVEREIRLTESYTLEVKDRFINESEQPLQMPPYGLRSGGMHPLPGVTSTRGVLALAVDSLSPAESVRHWGRSISGWLKDSTAATIRHPLAEKGKPAKPMDWVAVKNKYFVQSLRPLDLATESAVVYITRDGISTDPAEISASLQFPEGVLAAGESFTREIIYYVGPQKYDELTALGYHQNEIMELGWKMIRFFAVGMLWGMTKLHGLFGNYGVAIMLLTLFIRLIFWPLTHKGTESMRRMQELSPLMKALNEKYKADPQKRQQALMELYKEHKVNPLGGCLPMVVQIPVFIGLFYVLRTAIDLRFSSFLWIDDLSEPEGLLHGMLPFGLSLNILPLLMAVTMYFQQKLTPMASGGDEKQQQMQQMMMRVMPLMMLVMLYNFASGLALYWTTQNLFMIVQQVLYRRRVAHRKAEASAREAAQQVTAQKEPKKGRRK